MYCSAHSLYCASPALCNAQLPRTVSVHYAGGPCPITCTCAMPSPSCLSASVSVSAASTSPELPASPTPRRTWSLLPLPCWSCEMSSFRSSCRASHCSCSQYKGNRYTLCQPWTTPRAQHSAQMQSTKACRCKSAAQEPLVMQSLITSCARKGNGSYASILHAPQEPSSDARVPTKPTPLWLSHLAAEEELTAHAGG